MIVVLISGGNPRTLKVAAATYRQKKGVGGTHKRECKQLAAAFLTDQLTREEFRQQAGGLAEADKRTLLDLIRRRILRWNVQLSVHQQQALHDVEDSLVTEYTTYDDFDREFYQEGAGE